MKFSIIIPLYNKAAYIRGTIESVLAQSFTDFEVIVVDDGSTDDGADLVSTMNDPRLSLARQANAGVSAARNRGISLARGEWIAFLDADDWHHPGYLACLLATQHAFPHADAVATTFLTVPDAKGAWPPVWPIPQANPHLEVITNLPHRWLKSQSFCTCSIAVRTQRLQEMQPCFPPGESSAEDLDLWFRLAEQVPIVLAHSPLVIYRIATHGSLSSEHHLALTMPPAIERMRARALSTSLTPVQSRSTLWFIAQLEVSIARDALASGQRVKALKWLFKGRLAASGLSWWLTAAMVFLSPRKMVRSWNQWRVRRAVQAIETAHAGRLHET